MADISQIQIGADSYNIKGTPTTWYGTSSSTGSTLTATCTGFVLSTGAFLALQMTAANSDTSAAKTLNVNSTGAKTVYADGAATSTSNTLTWYNGEIVNFVYDGSHWRYMGRSGIIPAARGVGF